MTAANPSDQPSTPSAAEQSGESGVGSSDASRWTSDAMLALLDAYVADGAADEATLAAWTTWAAAAGLRSENRNGVLVAINAAGRVVAAMDTSPPPDWHGTVPIPAIPCFTCGSLPVDTFHDGSSRYDCGPHAPSVASRGMP